MATRSRRAIMLAAVGMFCCSALSAQDPVAVKGREILAKYKDAVVTVQLVIKTSFSGPGFGSETSESKAEATGTVIDPSGLTVISLSNIDPSSLFGGLMGGGGFSVNTEVQDVKILLGDGTEVASEVVLRDRELDLAFVRPIEKPEKPMVATDLSDAVEVDILDRVISLNRLGKIARRVHSASLERIDAVVTKPRRFYIPGNDNTTTGLGSPVFSLDAKLVGIFVIRSLGSPTGGGAALFGVEDEPFRIIIVPAEEILESAKQVPPWR